MDKQKKTTVHSLSLPYPDPQWPPISTENEHAILHFLLPLLQPVGDFRRDHVPRSKGKGRAGKANRRPEQDSSLAWMPDVYDHLTIGFNSTVRRLESLTRSRKPQILCQETDSSEPSTGVGVSVVFVCRQALPDIMTSSLPLLVATSAPSSTRAKLVTLSMEAEQKLAQALHQPRVGVLGVHGETTGAEALLRFVQENIAAVDVPWLDQANPPAYHSVKINSTATTAKLKPAAQGRKRKGLEDG